MPEKGFVSARPATGNQNKRPAPARRKLPGNLADQL